MKKPGEAVANRLLRSARESKGWTQEELAEMVGTTGVTISRWESGITFPSHYYRRKLSVIYGKSAQELGLWPEDIARDGLDDRRVSVQTMSQTGEDLRPAQKLPIFLLNEPLPGPLEFYGRQRACETLLSRTARRASTSIVGRSRIGKTWLLDYLRLVAPAELGSRFRIGLLDGTTPSCGTVAGFVAEALETLGLASSNHVPESLLDLELGLKLLRASNRVPVLCIDEFEGLCHREEFDQEFFYGLRALTHCYGLVLVVISRRPLSALVAERAALGSFFTIFEEIRLLPFSQEETNCFIHEKSLQAGFVEAEQELLWHYGREETGGWSPLRLQLVGKMLLNERYEALSQGVTALERLDIAHRQRFEQGFQEAYYGVGGVSVS